MLNLGGWVGPGEITGVISFIKKSLSYQLQSSSMCSQKLCSHCDSRGCSRTSGNTSCGCNRGSSGTRQTFYSKEITAIISRVGLQDLTEQIYSNFGESLGWVGIDLSAILGSPWVGPD